ncbi:hypothetical protein [Allokutzneria albata]|uniref:hypothetical protein n=1 Tax=Allokutzneria albata TaxID=211114 RepID=UPI0004C3947E|nr:hypothetical protein [Allokutzneria albata]
MCPLLTAAAAAKVYQPSDAKKVVDEGMNGGTGEPITGLGAAAAAPRTAWSRSCAASCSRSSPQTHRTWHWRRACQGGDGVCTV